MTRRIAAPAETVFDAWLDQRTAGEWLFATADGEMVKVEIDARVGGRFEIVERRGGEDVLHAGVYEALERPVRLAFTLQVPLYSTSSERVRIGIAAADGGCELTLTQSVASDAPASRERIEEGWSTVIGALAERLESEGGEG
ncbi:MAG TPA: SRPBCC domain-containing protein [Allosphingosinicella sp.]|nr:SRPBCC domain-containing protein [Allosphingosinicella sp.]